MIVDILNSIKSRLASLLGILKYLVTFIVGALVSFLISMALYYFLFYPSLQGFYQSLQLQGQQGAGTTTTNTTTVTPPTGTSTTSSNSILSDIASTFSQIPDIISAIPEQIAGFLVLTEVVSELINNLSQRTARNFTRGMEPAQKIYVEPQPFSINLGTLLQNIESSGMVTKSKNEKGEDVFTINKRVRGIWQRE